MAVTIAACRTLTAARPLALASRVSWFRFRATPFSWAMKSSCSRVIRARYRSSVDQLAQHFGRRLPCLAAKGRKAEFPFGTEPGADDISADAADADFRAPALFAVCFLRCFHDKWCVSIFLFRPAGFYGGHRVRRSFRLRKHNLAFLKSLPLSDAVVQFPPFPLSGLADYSEEPEQPLFRERSSVSKAFVFGLLCGRSDSRLRPCVRCKNAFGRLPRCGGKDGSDRRSFYARLHRCQRRRGSPDAG